MPVGSHTRHASTPAVSAATPARWRHTAHSAPDLSDSTGPKSSSGADKEDLEHCYKVTTRPLESLKPHIRSIQPAVIHNVCQYCGLGPSTTFDHHLSKESFPEFSVLSLNLVPSCGPCNQHKSTTFLKAGERQIINLYFDLVPTEQYLFVELDYKDDLPIANYRLVQPTSLDSSVFRRIQSHYDRLNLLSRFREHSVAPISEARSSARVHCGTLGRETVRSYLAKEAWRLAKDYSPNHWKAVLFRVYQ